MDDPEIRKLLNKAEEQKAMSQRLMAQRRNLKEQADDLTRHNQAEIGAGRSISSVIV